MKHLANALFIFSVTLIYLAPTFAEDGKTANGCTYKVVQGKYVADCSARTAPNSWATQAVATRAGAASAPMAAPQSTRPPGPIVESYSNVPVAGERAAPRSSAPTVAVPMELVHQGRVLPLEENSREELPPRARAARTKDGTYIGATLGSVALNDPHVDAGAGLGLTLGTNLDEFFGTELSYSYTEMSGSLGLNRRQGIFLANDASSDIQVRSHWVSAEVLAHITDETYRLRPYGGLGLGWKNTSMKDTRGSGLSRSFANTLSQNSVGISSSVGAKLRVSHDVQIGLAGKFFIPVWRQDPDLQSQSLKTPNTDNGALAESDRSVTGASVWSVLGTVQYLF